MNCRCRAFSLIELLVTVAILGVLVGLLLPAFSNAKQRAFSTLCANNLRQQQLALLFYANDNDDWFPFTESFARAGWKPWVSGVIGLENNLNIARSSTNTILLTHPDHAAHSAYITALQSFRCPSDRSYVILGSGRHPRVRSYALNFWIGTWLGDDIDYHARFRKLSDTRIDSPSGLFTFSEFHEDTVADSAFSIPQKFSTSESLGILPSGRHSRGATFSFVDGHTEIKRWRSSSTIRPVTRQVQFLAYEENPDQEWLRARATKLVIVP